jgi:LmbE family N-acetylglucosaminyl deacetylase
MKKIKLFLAPHNDDEALFGSYAIMREKPIVLVITDGKKHQDRGIATMEQRRSESKAAMKVLRARVEFIGIPDDELTEQLLFDRLNGPTHEIVAVYAPAILENGNEDHNVVGKVADRLWPGKVKHYFTYTKDNLTPRGNIEIKPTPEEEKLKNEALSKYTSQLRCNGPHFDAVRGKSEYLC